MIIQANEELKLVTLVAGSVDYIIESADAVSTQGNIASATTTKLVGKSTIRRMSFVNLHASAQTLRLNKSVRSDRLYRVAGDVVLAQYESLVYTPEGGFKKYDSDGQLKVTTTPPTNVVTSLPGLPDLTAVEPSNGTGPEDLIVYSIPANTLANNGDIVELFGGGSTLIGTTLAFYLNGSEEFRNFSSCDAGEWWFTVRIIRLTSTTARAAMMLGAGNWASGASGGPAEANANLITGLDFTTTIEFKLVIDPDSGSYVPGNIRQDYLAGMFIPAG
jgi:hypothetical protein